MKLARHIRSIRGVAAALALLAGLAAPSLSVAQAPPTGMAGGAASARARQANPRLAARKAPALMLLPAWTVDLPSPPYPGAAVDQTRGYVVLRSARLLALALETGETTWSVPAGEIVVPPVAGLGLVFLAHEREVEAFDASTGARRWRAGLDAPVSAPLVLTGSGLLALTGSGGATMLGAADGRVAWTRALGGASRVRPAADGSRIYVALDDGRVLALAPATGETAWSVTLPAPAATIDTSGDRVLVGASDKFLYCLSAKRGHRDWRWRTGGAAVGRVASDRHHLYFAALDNVLRALDRRHGQQIWKAPLAHRPVGGVYLAARMLWVPGIAASVAAFETLDGSPVSESPLAGDLAAAPQVRVSPSGVFDGAFVVSGDGKAQWLVPGPPPLPAKALPQPAIGPPDIKGGSDGN